MGGLLSWLGQGDKGYLLGSLIILMLISDVFKLQKLELRPPRCG